MHNSVSLERGHHSQFNQLPSEVVLKTVARCLAYCPAYRLSLISKRVQSLLRNSETSLCKQVVDESFFLEAECFPPQLHKRNHRIGWYARTELNGPAVEELKKTQPSNRKSGLCFKANTFEYLSFLRHIKARVDSFESTVQDHLGVGQGNHQNCLVLWCFTEGFETAFTELPRKVRMKFDAFLTDISLRFASRLPFECVVVDRNAYMDQQTLSSAPRHMTYDEIEGVAALVVKFWFLTLGAAKIEPLLAGLYDERPQDEVHTMLSCVASIDLEGDYFNVRFLNNRSPDPLSRLERALSSDEAQLQLDLLGGGAHKIPRRPVV